MKLKTDFIISHFVSFVFTILVWLSMTTSVRKGLALYDASIFEYFGYAMNHGQVMYKLKNNHIPTILAFVKNTIEKNIPFRMTSIGLILLVNE